MARRARQSPVFYEPAPARWPWVLLLALLLGAAAYGFVARPDLPPFSTLHGLLGQQAPQPQTEATPHPGVAEATAPANDTVVATASPAAPDLSEAEVAAAWVDRWNSGDYAGMYALTSGAIQRAIPVADFVARYEGIAERAELTSVNAALTGEVSARRAPISVTFDSSVVGSFSEENTIPLVRESAGWRVAWNPSLIFAGLGSDGCVDVDTLPAGRGKILDRNGEPLAYDGTVQRVGIVPGQVPAEQYDQILDKLADLTDMKAADIEKLYAGADPNWFVPIKDFPDSDRERLLDIISQLPGISVKAATARVYPLGEKAAHITGYIAEPTAEQLAADPNLAAGQPVGQAGIEAGADEVLAGVPGGRLIVVQCTSRVERSTIASREPVEPRDVQLTIDRDFQASVYDALRAEPKLQGAAVVLDPQDGGVLALASVPSYDPNGFVLGFTESERTALRSESQRPLLSRAAEGAYPTGSAFKPITFVAGMEDLGYTGDTVLDCPSTFQLDGAAQVWEDWTVAYQLPAQGPLTLHNALVNSCNTVFYGIGRDLDLKDPELLPAMAKAFGLGAPTGIPYLPEAGGVVPDPAWKLETFGDYWATGDAVNLSIGQGFLQVTPLQLANAYAAIANGGDLLQPFIVSTIIDENGNRQTVGERTLKHHLPVSDDTLAALQSAMHDQTADSNGNGSFRVFGDMAFPIAGKTGTAQRSESATAKPHSWFGSYGPYGGTAEVATAVMYESAGEGVSFAAPATRRIYDAWLQSPLRQELYPALS
ncbi:MAG: penicillin-binding transpeptidase domain-containing protein [Thermomicrobiales bacterium]